MIQKFSAVVVLFLVVLCLLLSLGSVLYPKAPTAEMLFDRNEINIGGVGGEGILQVQFDVRNSGECDLNLKSKLDTESAEGLSATEELLIAPGEVKPIVVSVQKEKMTGQFRLEVPYQSNDQAHPEVSFFVKGFNMGRPRARIYNTSVQARYLRD